MSVHESIKGYSHISDITKQTTEYLTKFRSGEINPIKTSSLKEQEKLGGFLPGEQITLAGRTGTGKSAFVLQWIKDFVNVSLNPSTAENTIVLFDSWEMMPWRHMLRLYSSNLEMDVKSILDYHKRLTQEQFSNIISQEDKFNNLPIYFSHISENVKTWVENKKRIRDKFPNKIIINIVDHSRLVLKQNENSEQELIHNFMVAAMKLKLELNTINVFLSQLNRNIESSSPNRESIGRNLPVSSDIFGSDSVYQCSDFVIALHRPGFYGLTEWEGIPTGKTKDPNSEDNLLVECILKQRDGWTGNLTRTHNFAYNIIKDRTDEENARNY